ncbi:hypothetical protein B9Z55_000627 [Caenorhabditis nigoni]|uniref:Uncharacterized protein n=1 Tax=Caenorhabditis nigoni TaxID=1611254 RepID=A0A2G5VU37_9PELO|nr:hypothetical protein B9Z55_000627 [Caenorhabditis nigoni]
MYRPHQKTTNARYIDHEDEKTSNTDPITSHIYVVRESDNRVASVLIQGRKFRFGVWDKTEEEFLKMTPY